MRPLPSTGIVKPRQFGRRPRFSLATVPAPERTEPLADLKLFATTFLGGFLFVAVYLA